MKFFTYLVFAGIGILLFLISSSNYASAQCANNNTYWTDITPTGPGSTVASGCMYAGEYCTVDVCSGANYTFSTCGGATYDTQITIYSSTGTYIAYNDDGCGIESTVSWTATFNGTVYVLLDQYNCVSNSICTTLTCTQNTSCAGASTICDCDGQEIDESFTLWLGDGFADDGAFGVNFNCATWGYDCGDIPGAPNVDPYGVCLGNLPPNNGCMGDCFIYDVYADSNGCVGTQEWLTLYVDYDGACYVSSLWVYTDLFGWEELVLVPFAYYSMDPIDIYLNLSLTTFDFYFVLSDGTTSGTYFYDTIDCNGAVCTNLDSDAFGAGCQDYLGTLEEVVDIYFYFSGDCSVEGMYLGLSGELFDYYDLSLDGLGNGDVSSYYFFADNSLYEYYFILSDGSVSPSFYYLTGDCLTGCDDAFLYLSPDCYGDEISWEITDLFGNVLYEAPAGTYGVSFPNGPGLFYSDLCLDEGCYYFTIYDTFGDGLAGAQYANCDVDGYYYMSDGTGNILFESGVANFGYSTSHFFCISYGGCSNLDAEATEGSCNGELLPFYIDFFFNGGCTVNQVCISEDGGLYTCYDVSGYALQDGDGVVYNIGQPNSYYYYYYILSDGTESGDFFFQNGPCEDPGYICDCDGTQHTAGVLSWLGDGFADDGTYSWNGQPVNFDCAVWGYDCGDIYTDGFFYDPYGVCSGNLPPGNGCIVDESCNLVYFEVTTDCYPGETSIAVFDDLGNLVYDTGLGALTDEYATYGAMLCLPTGCYTYAIFDSFGDGLSAPGCTQDGDYAIYDGNDFSLIGTGPAAFGDAYYIEFCVGEENVCANLQLLLDQVPCQSDGILLYPEISFTFLYNGACTVDEICWSEDGGPFTCSDVSAFGWESGDTGYLQYTTPDAYYAFYYLLSDGTYSSVFYWQNGNCNNEITICDCDGTEHTWGVLAWLGDGFADNGFYDWAGQPVNFNCATWGYDCGDIAGAPNLDPYGVCSGGLPPNNGCNSGVILGCTDPLALNYNPFATVNDGSCFYKVFTGCTDEDACNYNEQAQEDDGSCEYITCAGCTDDTAINYDPTATLDDGSCLYEEIEGCTDVEALNYSPLATIDDGSCVYSCVWPIIEYDTYCVPGNTDGYYISVDVNDLGNGAPYILTNSNNDDQVLLNFLGVIELGPFNNNSTVVIQIVSNTLESCFITSPILNDDCSSGIISGCTDELATNYYADATEDDGSCEYDFMICDCDQQMISPDQRFRLGDGIADTGLGNSPNFNCLAWGYDCGDIIGAPNEDPYNVCSGNLPSVLIATNTGCPVGTDELDAGAISIYPNPNNGQFILQNGWSTSHLLVKIFDNTGQVVDEGEYYIPQRSSRSFDLSHLAQGTYHVAIVSGSFVEHHWLVIQR